MDIHEAADVICEVALAEGFTPLGLFECVQDYRNSPESYGEEYLRGREQELFADYPGMTFADVTRQASRIAAGAKDEACWDGR